MKFNYVMRSVWSYVCQLFSTTTVPPESEYLRLYLLQLHDQGNPINLDIIEWIGQFPTRKAAAAWQSRQEASGALTLVGLMKDSQGRKVMKVFCGGGVKPKDDNLRHWCIGTTVRILFAVFQFEREPREPCFTDMVMTDGEHTYEIEICCGTMPAKRHKSRCKRHKCENDILIVTAPLTGNAETRLQQLIEWSADLGERVFVTTLDRLKTVGPFERVWDFPGRGNAPLKRVKLPVVSQFQSYMEDTPQMATAQGESEGDDDQN